MKKQVSILMIALLAVFASCSSDDDDKMVYTVTFETDGGSPTPSVQRVEEGSMATAPSANPAKTGYVFVFWHVSGATTAYNFQTPIKGDMTLYAKWQEEATAEYWQVTWNLNGGTWPADNNHAALVLKSGTLAEPNAPTKPGRTFDGWYKESALTNKVTFPYDVSSLTADFTLYAKWQDVGGEAGVFTSITALSDWLKNKPENTVEATYRVKLNGINLDNGNNWGDLGIAVGVTNKTKYVELDLSGCTGTAIPDGRQEAKQEGGKIHITYYGVFVGCANLVSVILPDSLTSIGKYAFYECTNLLTASLPKGLTSIGYFAFKECKNLHTASLPDGLKIIGEDAFCYTGLESVTIPGSVNDWGKSAFSNCYALHTVVVREGVERIVRMAFMNCYGLKSVTLPEGLKTIDEKAFWMATGGGQRPPLETIEIPASVTHINNQAFYGTGVTLFIMRPLTPPVLHDRYTLRDHTGMMIIKVPPKSLEAYKAAWTSYGYDSELYGTKIEANTD